MPVGGAARFRKVAAGTTHTCAIRVEGTLWCWGRNWAGQLGTGDRASSTVPVQVGDRRDWRDVAVGGGHSCAIDAAGALSCWGGGDYGQSGTNPPPAYTTRPSPIAGTWLAVSSHFYDTCAVRADRTLWCWGDNVAPADGNPPRMDQPLLPPAQVGADADWIAIAVGVNHACGVRRGGVLACGGLGVVRGDFAAAGSATDWGDVVASAYHDCALEQGGALSCWGRNDTGQLGLGTIQTLNAPGVDAPASVAAGSTWTSIAALADGTCGLQGDGSTWCWGHVLGTPFDPAVAPVTKPSRVP
jgi:alpha-tubulin suppressor-like RCC1 family protein